ncbi:MAG: alpha/beta hydrolase [Proteobacteria bacterium]|nr:alpha/beta hydrolase [Pseudomonadota bacterium]
METNTIIMSIFAFAIAPAFISMLMEALRKTPLTPEKLYWDNSLEIQYVQLKDSKLRYIKTGQGPNLVLLHTLRTQLDIFEKVIPELSKSFTVYALDHPGHGFSSIPDVEYEPELFVNAVEQFMDKLDISNATLAGISIGGSIPLLIAAKHNQRVKNVVAINPYDYGNGRGVERGNFVAWLIFTLARIPVLGETVMRFRNPMIEQQIFKGGVFEAKALTTGFLQQVWQSGIRKGHYRAFINLVRNASKWETARAVYGNINVPVTLVYGDNDWSTAEEREQNNRDIPNSTIEIIKDGGHFLSLDRPNEVIGAITQSIS